MNDIAMHVDNMPRMPLEHRKSTAREGWGVVAGLGIPLAGFIAFAVFILSRESLEWWGIALASVILGSFTAAVGLYAIANIRARGEFSCRLDEERFTCESPVKGCGDRFDLPVADIVKIERESWSDDCRWYVWDAEGKRYWLTSNYDNPDGQFIAHLQLLRPDIERVDK